MKSIYILILFLISSLLFAQEKSSKETESVTFPVSFFVRDANVVDYNFTDEQIFYSPCFATGINVEHKTSFIELGAFINKNDYYGFMLSAATALEMKKIDNNWLRAIAIIGQVCYYPSQQSDPDLWMYFSGIVVAYIYPMNWGSLILAGMPGLSYANEKWSLTTLTMINLSIKLN